MLIVELGLRQVGLSNSLITSEQCLYQFYLTNLPLRAKSNKNDGNIASEQTILYIYRYLVNFEKV